MPELPEVETIVRCLKSLEGETLHKVEVLSSEILKIPPESFTQNSVHKKIQALTRKGKYIVFLLEDSSKIVFHLGMTGQILLEGPADSKEEGHAPRAFRRAYSLPDKHTHLILHAGSQRLFYRDVRKFGFVDFILSGEARGESYFSKLGWDPLDVGEEFLIERVKKRKARIKPLLLSQKVVAGLGNIYVDETLFRAGIHPLRKAAALSQGRLHRLFESMRAVLKEAIHRGGSSIDDYVHPDGSRGAFQKYHRIYGRQGEPCPQCGVEIRKIKLAGRGTTYCPHCQR